MADRYVNYDKLLETRQQLGLDEMSKIHKVNAFNHFIDNLPTADVVEVKHGKWMPICEFVQAPFSTVKYRKRTAWECSVCGKRETENIRKQECVCGAKMDGGKTE